MAKQDPGDDLSKEIRRQNKPLFHSDLLYPISEPIRLNWQEKWRILFSVTVDGYSDIAQRH